VSVVPMVLGILIYINILCLCVTMVVTIRLFLGGFVFLPLFWSSMVILPLFFRLCDFTFNFQNEIRFALVLLIALNGVSSP
jgi:hypothetical protein